MKKYILSAILLGVLSGMSSCSDWLDVNHNPNAAEKVEPGYLFNYVAVAWSGTRTSGDFYIPISQSLQIQADGGDSYGGWAEGNYVISPYSVGNVWKGYYNSSANNLKLAIKMAREASVVNNNAIAQCNVIFAEPQNYAESLRIQNYPLSVDSNSFSISSIVGRLPRKSFGKACPNS